MDTIAGMREVRKRAGAGFWVTVVVVAVLIGYPLSFGPACWLSERTVVGSRAISIAYQPLLGLWMRTQLLGRGIAWFALVGTKDGSYAINTVDGRYVLSWASE
jgi:hypothetical protein